MAKRDPFDNPEAKKWLDDVERDMLPKMKDSALSMVVFSGTIDAKLPEDPCRSRTGSRCHRSQRQQGPVAGDAEACDRGNSTGAAQARAGST
jgi:hypothetical protein